MSLYLKVKKDFIEITDYTSLQITDMVKIYSHKSNKFISKVPYLVKDIHDNQIILEGMDGRSIVFDIKSRKLIA